MTSILKYEKMIYKIIRKYSYNPNDFEDLYQVGMIALQKATENYKTGYNTEFSSYAFLYIKGEVLKHIRENRAIKVNKDCIKLNSLINKSKEVLAQKYMREPTLEEIALFLEVPLEKIIDASIANEYVWSLDYEVNDEGKELNLYDSVRYEEKGFDDRIIDLHTAMSELSEDERNLIKLRYYKDKSQQETSRELGMSQVQVSRSEKKILTKIKHKMVA